MTDFIFRLYSLAHLFAKRLLGHRVDASLKLFVPKHKAQMPVDDSLWLKFIEASCIKADSESSFNGLHYAGYTLEKHEWCLESWIWTNAAIVRMYVGQGRLNEGLKIGKILLSLQQQCGGWIVRNDYDSQGAIPMIAPNDSAYIANNAILSLYQATGDRRFLASARHCADWIMATCREDGMVYTGYNTRDNRWDKNHIIVDVGFTGGLFANLYRITNNAEYKIFLEKFIKRYIELFYLSKFHGFATSINKEDCPQGGMFARGQAWALEGLIPAYQVLGDESIKDIIGSTIENLLHEQNKDGSWPYNLTRKLMGNDCKGVPVIARSLMDWYKINNDRRLLTAVSNAIDWCRKHTYNSGEATGGIFSFCTEGAVVKDLYTSCAFVYASAYAIEAVKLLNK